MFFVEAKYHHNPKRAADQVRYIAHREEGLPNGERRELYGIGPRYRAFHGDEKAMRKALVEDARGLRNPVYFRFILTVDTHTAERFARLDGRLTERVLADAVGKTFRGAARGVQGVFAIHQHGGEDRPAHPHGHALLSPRFEDKSPTHLSPLAIQAVRGRWEKEVLRGLERQERRIEHGRNERTRAGFHTASLAGACSSALARRAESTATASLGPVGVFFRQHPLHQVRRRRVHPPAGTRRGRVQGRTTNGGLDIRLAGSGWSGEGLDVTTTNGGVTLAVPADYNARIETGTTNGGLDVDFPVTLQGHIDANS